MILIAACLLRFVDVDVVVLGWGSNFNKHVNVRWPALWCWRGSSVVHFQMAYNTTSGFCVSCVAPRRRAMPSRTLMVVSREQGARRGRSTAVGVVVTGLQRLCINQVLAIGLWWLCNDFTTAMDDTVLCKGLNGVCNDVFKKDSVRYLRYIVDFVRVLYILTLLVRVGNDF